MALATVDQKAYKDLLLEFNPAIANAEKAAKPSTK